MFRIIWPENRLVSAQQINEWYNDAVANGEVDEEIENRFPHDQALALHDSGLITLARTS